MNEINVLSKEEMFEIPCTVMTEIASWWKPKFMDLFIANRSGNPRIVLSKTEKFILDCNGNNIRIIHCMPLLNETQLRKFCEFKTKGILDVSCFGKVHDKYNYNFESYCFNTHENSFMKDGDYNIRAVDLLHAYLELACKLCEGDNNE